MILMLQYFRMQSDAVVFEGSLGAVQHKHTCSTRHYHSVLSADSKRWERTLSESVQRPDTKMTLQYFRQGVFLITIKLKLKVYNSAISKIYKWKFTERSLINWPSDTKSSYDITIMNVKLLIANNKIIMIEACKNKL